MSLPSYLNTFINKAIVSIIVPEDASLNISAFDMGVEMASMSFDKETINRLEVAFGSVGSAEMAIEATITVTLNKKTQVAQNWRDRVIRNGLIPGANGEVVFTDDVGARYKLFACTCSIGDVTADGQSPVYNFTIKGNLAVNEDLYGTVIG